jgi:outer membrane lipoprotein-sorting protein
VDVLSCEESEKKKAMKIMSKLFVAAFVLSSAGVAWAQTADEIVDKTVTAMGGRAALSKLTSRSSTGTITVSTPGGDVAGTIEAMSALPNKSRTLITLDLSAVGAGSMVLDQRCDGTSGYALDSMRGNREITGGQLELMKQNIFPTPLLTYKERGTKIDVVGKDKIGDRDAYVLSVAPASGPVSKVFIDTQSNLPVKSVVTVSLPDLGEVEQTIELSDYREVDGIQVPFKVKGSSAIQTFTIAVSTVKHNVEIDSALFSRPAEK